MPTVIDTVGNGTINIIISEETPYLMQFNID